MEAGERECTPLIVQFKEQLGELMNTFHGISQAEQPAAILAVQKFLDELEVCRSQNLYCQPSSEEAMLKSAKQMFTNETTLADFDPFSKCQLPNTELDCELNCVESTFPVSNYGAFTKTCLEQLDHEFTSSNSSSNCVEAKEYNSDYTKLQDPTLNNTLTVHSNSNLNKAIRIPESVSLLNGIDIHSEDSSLSRHMLPELGTFTNSICDSNIVQNANGCAENYTENAAESLAREVSTNCCTFRPVIDEHYQKNAEIVPPERTEPKSANASIYNGIQSQEHPATNSVLDDVTMVAPNAGRITRSMVRINHRKQKLKSHSDKKLKTKLKRNRQMSKPAVPQKTNAILNDDQINPKLKDISNVQENDQEMEEICEGDQAIKKSQTTLSEESFLSSISACLPVRSSDAVSCRQCHLEFNNVVSFNKHTCKSDKPVFMCKPCNLHFNQPLKFQNHMNNHTRNSCKTCGVQFAKREALHKHNKLEHNIVEPEKYYHCPHCEQKFVKKPSLYSHLKEHADLKMVCMKCGAMCDGADLFEQHMSKHAEEANFHCDKCNENFLWRLQYDQHMAGHDKYDCTMCNTNFSTKKQMIKHKRMVHDIRTQDEKKHECTICHKRFPRLAMLEMHKAVHNGEKPVQCSVCGKNYRTLKSLTKHMQTAAHLKASGEFNGKPLPVDKSFLCAECGAKFYRKQGLARHMMQLHSEDRPFECPFCDYTCKCKTNLKRHVELHKNERRFVCELCGSSFHAHGTLKEHHAYVHSEDRQFVCQKCGKGFKGRSGLRRHIRSHSDNRPFQCYCGQSYKRMSHLKRHMLSIHNVTFKSKRVQRIGSDDPNSSAYDDSNPSTHFQNVQPISDLNFDASLQAQTINLPVTATDGLLIIDNTKNGPQKTAQVMNLEVTDMATRMEILPNNPQLMSQTLTASNQMNQVDSNNIPSIANNTQLPNTLLNTSELTQTFELGNVAIPLSHNNIAVIPPVLPQTIYHTVQTLDPSLSMSMPSTLPSDVSDLASHPSMQPIPPEFYTQILAQYLSM